MLSRITLYSFFAVFAVSASVHFFEPRERKEKQKGVCWVGGRERVTEAHIASLVENNVTWISQTPFGWQRKADSASIQFITTASTGANSGVMWGESDEGICETTQLARNKGIRTLLKPHLWIHQSWPGNVAMKDEASWHKWFADYEKFILHYAQLAEQNKMEALCIGTELSKATRREADWRKLIQKIRHIYKGKITYAANFHDEYEVIAFWDALDYIGIQAYFPLCESKNPSLNELIKGWQLYFAGIEKVVRKFQKPVIFTEIGYRSTTDAAVDPWTWPQQMAHAAVPSEATQALCYEAFFKAVWTQSWLEGAYFWKWYPQGPHRLAEIDFSPQGKEAERILAKNFSAQ